MSLKPRLLLHLLAPLLLWGLGALVWFDHNRAAYLHIDEAAYFGAFARIRDGGSPYEQDDYLYPPPLAVVGGRATDWWGERPVSLALRQLNLAGGCFAVWLAFTWARWPWWLRLGLAGMVVLFAPPFTWGVVHGNLSLLTVGAVLAGLRLWPRVPLLAGLSLGLSLVLKPMAPVAILALLLHRPTGPSLGHPWRQRITALTAGTSSLLLLALGHSFLPEMFTHLGGKPEAARVTSLHRLFYAFGLEVPAPVIGLGIALLAALLVRRRTMSQAELVAVAIAGSLLSLPVVWPHTLLLALPLQVMALALVLTRLRQAWHGGSASVLPFLWHEALPVFLAASSIFLSNGFGALEDAPSWLLGLLIAIPTLAPAALAVYLVARGDSPERSSSDSGAAALADSSSTAGT